VVSILAVFRPSALGGRPGEHRPECGRSGADAPGDIEKVLEAVEGVNPIFARLIRKAAGEAEKMLSTAASAG